MPELIVARNPTIGQAVPGFICSLGHQGRTPAQVTLLNKDQLRVGRDDIRNILNSYAENGEVTYTVDQGQLALKQRRRRSREY